VNPLTTQTGALTKEQQFRLRSPKYKQQLPSVLLRGAARVAKIPFILNLVATNDLYLPH